MNLVKAIPRSFAKQKPGAKAAVIVVILLAQCCICILPFTVMSITSGGEMVEAYQPTAAEQAAGELPGAQQEVAAEELPAAVSAAGELGVQASLAGWQERFPIFGSALQWVAAVSQP